MLGTLTSLGAGMRRNRFKWAEGLCLSARPADSLGSGSDDDSVAAELWRVMRRCD